MKRNQMLTAHPNSSGPHSFLTALIGLLLFTASTATGALTSDELARVKAWLKKPEKALIESLDLPEGLSKSEADQALKQLWQLVRESKANESPLGELPRNLPDTIVNGRIQPQLGKLALGEHTMRYLLLRREKNDPPESGRPLYLCMHGGGQNAQANGPHTWPINTREWEVQATLAVTDYPEGGIYWVPRMADDRLGRWWHAHNQQAIDQVIDHAVARWDVDPNRIYLLGISEGGYGTAILGPFMADRFAGASAMAAGVGLGNPTENLRNLAFRTDVGEKDIMFDRQKLAVAFHKRLDELHEQDPDGYTHSINLQKDKGHEIDYRQGPKWITEHSRNPFPKKVVWIDRPLDNQRRQRFYWIDLGDDDRDGRIRIAATADRDSNRIELVAERQVGRVEFGNPTHVEADIIERSESLSGQSVTLLLADELLDLDRPIKLFVNKTQEITLQPKRSATAILTSLVDRPDPSAAATFRPTITID